jgi:hypothetical protein
MVDAAEFCLELRQYVLNVHLTPSWRCKPNSVAAGMLLSLRTLLLSPLPIRRLTGKSAAVVQQMVN